MSARYQPVAPIAHGGMAKLELARMRGEQGFSKYVAVKRILPQWAEEHEFVAMFQDEARLIARLDHPNIVHVYDFARDDEGYFIAMEYIHGPSVRGLLSACRRSGTPMPVRHAVAIAIGVAAGLSHAHTRKGEDGHPLGIIHRDVSPTNVLVTHEGGVKLVDFGIAKAVSNKHRTRGNARKGKVAYMSPEQCKAGELDARSDVFALGAVLYEMLTGRRAFDGDDELAVMNAIVNHDVAPPSTHREDLPPALEAIVVQALQRDPDRRPASALEVEQALEELDGVRPSRAALGAWVSEATGRQALPWEGLTPTDSPDAESDGTRSRPRPTRAGPRAPDPAEESPTIALSPPSAASAQPPNPRRRWAGVALLALGGAALGVSWFVGTDATPPEPSSIPAAAARPTEPAAVADPAAVAGVVDSAPGGAPEPEPPLALPDASPDGESAPAATVEAADPTQPPAAVADPPRDEPRPTKSKTKSKTKNKKRPPRIPASSKPAETEPVEVEPFDPDGLSPRRREP